MVASSGWLPACSLPTSTTPRLGLRSVRRLEAATRIPHTPRSAKDTGVDELKPDAVGDENGLLRIHIGDGEVVDRHRSGFVVSEDGRNPWAPPLTCSRTSPMPRGGHPVRSDVPCPPLAPRTQHHVWPDCILSWRTLTDHPQPARNIDYHASETSTSERP